MKGSSDQISQLLGLLFARSDTILIRPVETWSEVDKKRSRVDYKGIRYQRPATLVAGFIKILAPCVAGDDLDAISDTE